MLGGLLLIAAALCLVVYNVMEAKSAAKYAQEAVRQLEELIPVRSKAQITHSEEQPAEVIEETETVQDYILDSEMEMPIVQIDGYDYIGLLEIPLLDISLPVMNDWSYPQLKLSPCRYTGSVYLDNMIIAAHNYAYHFGGLKSLSIGDIVLFTDVDGNQFSYTVSEIEQLGPNAVEEMESGDWELTLFTCTIGGKYRVTVRCERAENE